MEKELDLQMNYIDKIREINDKKGKDLYYYSLVMGCQMNARDSEKLTAMLSLMGYKETDDEKNADFIIYNTCCVRENAELKVYGKLGFLKSLKRKRKDITIALCGCMVQQEKALEKLKKSYKHVDIIFGTHNFYKFPELVYKNMMENKNVCDIWKEHKEIVEELPSQRQFKHKASVNIMYGCDNFCTYCIVPYVRGRERSRKPFDIIKEIKELVADGVKEITLLGQNVNSYGKNLDEEITFSELLREINNIDGLLRLNFMTSHPKDVSDDLIKAMGECSRVTKFLHLPFQSGSSRLLKEMNRKYTKEDYLKVIEKVKNAVPDIHLSTDIMVGFPGETEEDFLETLDVVKKVRFSNAYTFIYSKRSGTRAAEMENQIPEEVVKERFDRLLNEVNKIVEEINEEQVGRTLEVLVDEVNKQDEEFLTGRALNNTLVHFRGEKSLIGSVVPVLITENKIFYLMGEKK